jgi:hypothetical protein
MDYFFPTTSIWLVNTGPIEHLHHYRALARDVIHDVTDMLEIFLFLNRWLTAVKSQGKTITSSAVCHDSKTNEYLPNLDVEAPVWLDALERFYRPWQWPIFVHFLTLFPLKRPERRERNTSNMADVRRWTHRVTSLQVLYTWLTWRQTSLQCTVQCQRTSSHCTYPAAYSRIAMIIVKINSSTVTP